MCSKRNPYSLNCHEGAVVVFHKLCGTPQTSSKECTKLKSLSAMNFIWSAALSSTGLDQKQRNSSYCPYLVVLERRGTARMTCAAEQRWLDEMTIRRETLWYRFLCSSNIWSSLVRLLIFISMSRGWLLVSFWSRVTLYRIMPRITKSRSLARVTMDLSTAVDTPLSFVPCLPTPPSQPPVRHPAATYRTPSRID